ncbi:MAG: CehA/McbA family metallohydrolase, partial [Planctomycetota bacterium]
MRHPFGLPAILLSLFSLTAPAHAQEIPLAQGVEAQPLAAQVRRVSAALKHVGTPLASERAAGLERALALENTAALVLEVQRLLDPLVLAVVEVSAESRVKVVPGPATRELVQNGWRVFLVKVINEAGVTSALRCTSPNAVPPYRRSTNAAEPEVSVSEAAVRDRWLELDMFDERPLTATLSGLGLEYRLLLAYSRDAGRREAKLEFDVGQGTQDLGFRSEVSVLFECARAVPVTLHVLDVDGSPTTGQFIFRDSRGRVVPARARRLAPDFFFHDQIYRSDGQTVLLSPGEYEVQWSRGPEYKDLERRIVVPAAETHAETFQLERWIDAAALGWVSGDHHIHAAGCSHYESPSQGVGPGDMLLHILGEDLKVGCVLSWGPCWYFQKQFFDGQVHSLSTDTTLLRYDVEVSGFPSSHAGHLCLLRLTEDDYPGTTRIEEWPSWDLPVLRWGKSQGAVVGFSHSGWGLAVSGNQLPTLEVPRFDGIGANEYVVDVVHGVCDFISAVDTPA